MKDRGKFGKARFLLTRCIVLHIYNHCIFVPAEYFKLLIIPNDSVCSYSVENQLKDAAFCLRASSGSTWPDATFSASSTDKAFGGSGKWSTFFDTGA